MVIVELIFFMTLRAFLLTLLTIVWIGVAIAFLWVQVGLPTGGTESPWNSPIILFPSVYALWLPLIYLFFTSVWMLLVRKEASLTAHFFLRLDGYSYAFALLFFLVLAAWRESAAPALWLRGVILLLLLFKSVVLFRLLYHRPARIQPALLVLLGVGLHLLLFPFTYQKLALSLADVWQPPQLMQLATIAVKSGALSLMALEMFRLGVALTKSVRSAFFSWIAVLFTFPVLGFPKISYILAGLLLIFILRLIFSRLNTRELMLGLLTPTNIMILLKLAAILALLTVAGLIFWGNVKPGFEIQGGRALQAAIGTLCDGQFGLVSYAPLYWGAFFGGAYLLFFMVWDGVSLIMIGGTLYLGYHLAVYGMLGQSLEPGDIVPFLPLLGVFMAVAHARFGKMTLFRVGVRLAAIVTVAVTAALILLYPEIPSVPAKIAELQQAVTQALGCDLTYLAPSMVFRPFSASFWGWLSLMTMCALLFCNNRTRSGSLFARKMQRRLEPYFHFRELSFAPFLLMLFLLSGAWLMQAGDVRRLLPLTPPVALSQSREQAEILLDTPDLPHGPLRGKGLLIVSNLTGSIKTPDKAPIANVIILAQDQHFESFTLKAGKDTADERFEQAAVAEQIAHGRAAIYHSWHIAAEAAPAFLAHTYYTQLWFSKPLDVQKITFRFLGVNHTSLPPEMTFQLKELALIQ